MTLLLVAVLAVLLFWVLGAYNRLMRLRHAIGTAWQQLEPALLSLSQDGERLASLCPPELPAERAAFEALLQHSQDLGAAVRSVASAPYVADAVAQLAVAHALHGSALQRVQALLEALGRGGEPEDDGVSSARETRVQCLAQLRAALPLRDFGRQLFNHRVQIYNHALVEMPTRLLTGLFGIHDAKTF